MSQHVVIVCLVTFIVGFAIGYILAKIRTPDGILRVDTSDPEKDRYLMEFHTPLEDIPKKKSVKLKVRIGDRFDS